MIYLIIDIMFNDIIMICLLQIRSDGYKGSNMIRIVVEFIGN